MTDRKLVTIRSIDDLQPIEGADVIEKAVIGGWNVVVKKGEFSVGDLGVFFEIDSAIPATDERLSFLLKNKVTMNGKEFIRLRTIRLKGVYSQGLILPLALFPEIANPQLDEDYTELLNVEKYEKPVSSQLNGVTRGNFPSKGRKTDQERCQNIKREVQDAIDNDEEFEVSIKLDGSSMSIINVDEQTHVCSRNLSLDMNQEGNAFVNMAKSLGFPDLVNKYATYCGDLQISGELIGPGIQVIKKS
jgi:RNA ligase (TIGR02306 family)